MAFADATSGGHVVDCAELTAIQTVTGTTTLNTAVANALMMPPSDS